MKCMYCDVKLVTANSRPQNRSNSTWRRRKCPACKRSFTSVERIDLGSALAFKRDKNHVEPFSRHKLFVSIYEACKHRKHPVEDAKALTDTIMRKVLGSITTGYVLRGDMVLITQQVLKRFDHLAAANYTAYHARVEDRK